MSLIQSNVVAKIGELRTLSTKVRAELSAAKDDEFTKMFLVSEARSQLLELLSDDLVSRLMKLQGSPMGFKTDKDKDGGYSKEVIRTVAAQALMVGLRLTDNEINIIGGNLYAAKEGCKRLVKETPGVSGVEFISGRVEIIDRPPEIKKNRQGAEYSVSRNVAYVECWIRYRLNGKQCEEAFTEDRRIICKLDGGGEDMAIGKAERKAFKRLAEKLSGIDLGSDDDVIDVQATVVAEATENPLDQFEIELKEIVDAREIKSFRETWQNTLPDHSETILKMCKARYEDLKAEAVK